MNSNDSFVTLPASKVREMCQRTLRWVEGQREKRVKEVAQKFIDAENASIAKWAGVRKFFLLAPRYPLTLSDGVEVLKILTRNFDYEWSWDYLFATTAFKDERNVALRLLNATVALKADDDMLIGTKDLQAIQ